MYFPAMVKTSLFITRATKLGRSSLTVIILLRPQADKPSWFFLTDQVHKSD